MKAYVINLDRNPERMEAIGSRLDSLGIAYERVRAVDGAALSEEERRRAVRGLRWLCANGERVRPPQIGCALSHKAAYEKMLAEGEPVCCVLEDDAAFGSAAARVLGEVERFLDPDRAQVVLLSDHSKDVRGQSLSIDDVERLSGEDVRIERREGEWGAEAYCITRAAAKRILARNYPLVVPCDSWRRFRKMGYVELYGSYPPVATQNRASFASNINVGRGRRRRIHLWPLRAAGLAVDGVVSALERLFAK